MREWHNETDETETVSCSKLSRVCGCVLEERLDVQWDRVGAGTLARNEGLGGLLFLLAPILAFKLPRAAAISRLVACFVSLPLFLYLVFPRPFRQVWPGLWKGSDFRGKRSFGMDGGLRESSSWHWWHVSTAAASYAA